MDVLMKTVICIKWGDFFGPEYVNRIYGMVERNITPPFELHCFTDNNVGLNKEIISHPLPELGCDVPVNTIGKWRKTALWGEALSGLEGRTALFVDLDTVIVENIDCFFDYGNPQDVIVARNWLKPLHKLGQTTLFRFKVGHQPYMLSDFQKSPQAIADKYRFEQHYVTKHLKSPVVFWPNTWVKHYRHHCLGGYVSRYFKPASLPSGTKIVAFPGGPNPIDAVKGSWDNSEPLLPPLQHLLSAFSKEKRKNKSFGKYLKQYQLPCSWVEEHWKE